MSDLPTGWAWSTFGEVCENHDGRRVPVKAADRKVMSGSYPYYGASGIIDHVDDYLFDGVYLLVSEDGANLLARSKPIAFEASGKFWVNNHAHVVTAREGIVQRYVLHAIERLDLSSYVSGSAQPKVTQANLAKVPIPVPPLPEQRRIVAAIEEHFSRLDAADAMLQHAGRRSEALERAVFSAANDATWPESVLGDLLETIEAGKSFKTPGRPAEGVEWGVIKVSAMTWGKFDASENKAVVNVESVDPRNQIRSGDLLLSRANTSELVGATVLVDECPDRLLLSDKSMRLITKSNVNRQWLRYCLGSPALRAQMSAVASGTSDSMRNISQAKVKALRVSVPPQTEQHRVAEMISSQFATTERLASDLVVARRKAAALRRSVLTAAFSGQLVTPDPNDEPASVLLERIAAEGVGR